MKLVEKKQCRVYYPFIILHYLVLNTKYESDPTTAEDYRNLITIQIQCWISHYNFSLQSIIIILPRKT